MSSKVGAIGEAVPRTPNVRRIVEVTLVVLALVLHWSIAVTSVRDKAVTSDEVAHLTSGYVSLAKGDFRLNTEGSTFTQQWAALPLLGGDYTLPPPDETDWHRSNVWGIGEDFFFNYGNPIDEMLWKSRAMIALLSVMLGMVVYLWSRHLFGVAGGGVSLVLYAFCPNILAHARLVTTDVGASLFFILAVTSLWWLLHRKTWTRLLICALAILGLVLTKMSSVLLIPMAVVLVGVRLLNRQPLPVQLWSRRPADFDRRSSQLGVIAAAAAFVIAFVVVGLWANYRFRFTPALPEVAPFEQFGRPWTMLRETGSTLVVILANMRDLHLLPHAWLHGMAFTLHSSHARTTYFMGATSNLGTPLFFPISVAIKTPLALLGVLLLALGAAMSSKRRERKRKAAAATAAVGTNAADTVAAAPPPKSGPYTFVVDVSGNDAATQPAPAGRDDDDDAHPLTERSRTWADHIAYRLTPLFVLLAVYWLFSVTSNLNIGLRHVLLTYPVLYILAGGAGYWLTHRIVWRGAATVVMLGWFAAASLTAYPDYLSYFNEVVGSSKNGHKYLVDSSLDWGQDLPALADYLDQNNVDPDNTYLMLFTPARPAHYGVRGHTIIQFLRRGRFTLGSKEHLALKPGVYCVSQSILQGPFTRPRGPWVEAHEETYLKQVQLIREYESMTEDEQQALIAEVTMEPIDRAYEYYFSFRASRLAAYLRTKTPDAVPSPAIVVFNLDQQEVEEALSAPIADPLRRRVE